MWPFKKRNLFRILIDVSETSIALALVEYTGSSVRVCTDTRIAYGVPTSEIDANIITERLDELMAHTKSSCLTKYDKRGVENPDEILLSLSAPWQTTTMVPVVHKSDTPYTFTNEILDELIRDRVGKTFDRERVSFDTVVVDAKLNGYTVQNPIGRTVTRAEAMLLISVTEKKLTEALSSRLRMYYHRSRIEYVPYTKLYTSIRLLASPPLIFIHVRNESTRVCLIGSESVRAAYDMPRGMYSLTATPGTSAPELASAYTTDLVMALKEITVSTVLPTTVVLYVDGGQSSFFENVIMSDELESIWFGSAKPALTVCSKDKLRPDLISLSDDAMLYTLATYRL